MPKKKEKNQETTPKKRKNPLYNSVNMVKNRYVENKKVLAVVYTILRLSVVLVMIAQFFNHDYENVFFCVLTLILFMMPSMIERRLKIDLPDTLEIIILLFIYAAEILGEIRAYYIHFAYWDTMLHTINGFLCAAIGFSLVDLLNRNERLTFRLSPVFMAVTAFCFSMTVGVLWEFFEYFADVFFQTDMQKDMIVNTISTVRLDETLTNKEVVLKNITDTILVFGDGSTMNLGLGGYLDIGIHDTMKDLFVNFIGAVVFSIIGFFYIRSRGNSKFARRFIPALPWEDKQPETSEDAPQESQEQTE